MSWMPEFVFVALALLYGGLAIRHRTTNDELGVTGKVYLQQSVIFALVALVLFIF